MNYYVLVDGLIIDFSGFSKNGIKAFEEDNKFYLEYVYEEYIKGGADKRTQEVVKKVELNLNKEVSFTINKKSWSYNYGCFNVPKPINAKLIDGNAAYSIIDKKKPNYLLGNLLLSLKKEEEFLTILSKIKDSDTWSIYSTGAYEFLFVANSVGLGMAKNNKLAYLNAFRSCNSALISCAIKDGFAKKTIANTNYYLDEIKGYLSKAKYYLLGMGLIEEGFTKAGEAMILWGASCIAWNYPEFYALENKKALKYQSLLHKNASHINFLRGDYKNAIINYGIHLAYEKDGNDLSINYEEDRMVGDEYDHTYSTVNVTNEERAVDLVKNASMHNDKYAKELFSHYLSSR